MFYSRAAFVGGVREELEGSLLGCAGLGCGMIDEETGWIVVLYCCFVYG